ncbi:MAG: ATP-binding protein [Candidatus Zixiibacteriota bacterium]|jgi:serine/threonine-protein kinase RsbW
MDKPIIAGDTITIPSSQDFLSDVDLFVEGTLRGYGAEESVIADIAISVSELVNNAIIHGNKAIREKPVVVTVTRAGKNISIAVRDQGGGFDPRKIQNPIEDDNLMKEVGRGIFIVESLMDAVDITPSSTGTTITITKGI